MSDHSLMNPDHLRSEIRDLENELIPQGEKLQAEMTEKCDRIFEMIRDRHFEGEDTTFSSDEVFDIIRVLSDFKFHSYRYTRSDKFLLRVLKHLLKDRRYFIAAKYLKFLKK
jgi:hypothetical protein